jgi:glycosyltransferase involved in cell wall biosynthesis
MAKSYVERNNIAVSNTSFVRASELGADIICFMDADCLPEPGWVEAMEAAQKLQPGIVSGCTISTAPDSAIGISTNYCRIDD